MNINKIGNLWIKNPKTLNVLKKHDIPNQFFLKHFGYKILKNIEKIAKQEANVDEYPIMYVFLKIFKSKKIFFYDIEDICYGLIQTIKENFDEESVMEFEYIIKEKLKSIREDIEYDNPFILDANLLDDKERLKDIRFSSNNDLSSHDLENLLDDSIYTKIELFQAQLDDLIFLIDNLERKDAKIVVEYLPQIISKYELFKNLIGSIGFFPILENSFSNLISFLETIDEKLLEDFSKREQLIIMLDGLNSDIANWIDTVFIKKEAEDVYYFDASFANNCLEIELQCGKQKDFEKGNKEVDEIISDDSLMFLEV